MIEVHENNAAWARTNRAGNAPQSRSGLTGFKFDYELSLTINAGLNFDFGLRCKQEHGLTLHLQENLCLARLARHLRFVECCPFGLRAQA